MPDPCPNCGAPRSEAGLCPRCLMGNALPSDAEITYSFQPHDPARVLETLTRTIGPMPRVLLPDTAGSLDDSPLVKPSSAEMPTSADRSTRVQLLGEIARGGMGAVLKGRDPDLGRDLAVKVLLETHRGNPDLIRRFVEEAQIGGQLQHPGIVPVYELGTFGDARPYFTMKLVKGRTLADLLGSRKTPADELSRYLGIFEQIAQTVAYAHARGVIHRDLKPSNVMVGSFGEVQVMDWGLAKVLPKGGVIDDASAGKIEVHETVIATARSGTDDSDLSRAGSVMGTPSYMAPEQARGEIDQIDERADVFALGSILCEILTGQPAFTGRTSGEILRKAALGDLAEAFARLEASESDPELIVLTRNCLAREPDDRPIDASEVAGRVASYLAGVQQKLRRAELESVEERGRRRLTTVVAAAMILLGMAGSGGYVWNQQQKAERVARTARAVDEALADAARLRGEAQANPPGETTRWSEALSAAKRAYGLLSQGESDAPLRTRVNLLLAKLDHEQASAAERAARLKVDRVLLENLESARIGLTEDYNPKRTDDEYTAAFVKAGLDIDKSGATKAGEWLSSRSEPVEMAGYLDHWSQVRQQSQRPEGDWRRLVEAARVADPDPWRDALRTRIATRDAGAAAEFRRLADDAAELEAQPAASLTMLARHLKKDPSGRDRALRVLRLAVSRYPTDFWAHFELSDCDAHIISRDSWEWVEESYRHMTAAVAIRPGCSKARYLLGILHRLQNKPDEAASEYRELLRLKPDYYGVHQNLAEALLSSGKLDEAVPEYREAIRLKPDDAGAHYGLGTVLHDQKKLDESATEFREAIRLLPDHAYAHFHLGKVMNDQGKLDEAAAEFRGAIRLMPDDSDFHHFFGIVLFRLKKLAEAAVEFREAIRLKPDHAEAYCNLGSLLREQGDYAGAIEMLRKGHELRIKYPGWNYPSAQWLADAHYNFGNILHGQGRAERAVVEYHEAIRLKPDFAEAHCNLGMVLRSQGDYAGSLAMLRKGHELGSRQSGWKYPSAD